VPPLDQDTGRRSRELSEVEIERIVLMEMRRGYIAADHPEPDRHAATEAASWLMETEVGCTSDPCRSAANYAKVLASHLAEDDLAQRIVWRICARILAEAGLSMEPSPATIRSLFQTARAESLPEVTEWFRREQWLAGPRAISPSEKVGAKRKKSRKGGRKS
jgi:hypothetical protein